MNYFAHGMRFTDRPYFLAGTAVPDWLSAFDRGVRMRHRRVVPFVDESDPVQAEVAAGVLQHLHDDRWFHETRAFVETSAELTRLFRKLLGPEDGFRPGFLGHILTELILDGVLIDANPDRIDGYYRALEQVDPERIQRAVNRMAKKPASKLAVMIPLFCREQFLRDYLKPNRLLYRLNQVMRRIKLKQLPGETEALITAAWSIVKSRHYDLLPIHNFEGTPRCSTA